MPTAAALKGSVAEIAISEETTYGVASVATYSRTPIYSDSLEEKQGWEDDDVLSSDKHNGMDAVEPAPSLPSADGSIEVPLDLNHIGWWLRGAMGNPTTTGSGDYTHTFTSGKSILPFRTLEKKLSTTLQLQYVGLLTKSLGFNMAREGGYARVNVGCIFKKENKLTTSIAGTTSLITRIPVARFKPVFKIAGATVADVLSLDATYDNAATQDDSLGDSSGYSLGVDLDGFATFTGSFRLRFRNSTVYDLAKARTALLTELLWSNSSTRQLSITPAALYLEPAGAPLRGGGRIEASFNFKCAQTSIAPLITATLKNSQTSYPT